MPGDATKSFTSAAAALEKLNQDTLTAKASLSDLSSIFSNAGDGIESAIGNMAGIMNIIPGFQLTANITEKLGTAFGGLASLTGELVDTVDSVTSAYDSATSGSRIYNKELKALGDQYGLTLEESLKFGDFIYETGRMTKDFSFIDPAERGNAAKAFTAAGISLEKLGEVIQTTTGDLDVLDSSILHSSALGIDMSKYMSLLSTGIMKGGLTAQQSAEQIANYADLAKDVGLPFETIASTLDSIADGFSLIGIKADFGAPLLQNFSSSLGKVGLGIENSLELTKSFSNSIEKLTSDYSTAYFTFKQGGLDFGGGDGALGASIGFRQKLREAKESGQQGDIALDVAKSIKASIEAQTGGRIITLKEASEDQSLQSIFYTQEKMLETLHGISGVEQQDAILDMLSNIDGTMDDGNKATLSELEKQLSEGKDDRNTLITTNDILSKMLGAANIELIKQTYSLQMIASGKGFDFISAIPDLLKSESLTEGGFEEIRKYLGMEDEKTFSNEYMTQIVEQFKNSFKMFSSEKSNNEDSLSDTSTGIIEGTSQNIGLLVDKITELITELKQERASSRSNPLIGGQR